jgi:hypothetical protein
MSNIVYIATSLDGYISGSLSSRVGNRDRVH